MFETVKIFQTPSSRHDRLGIQSLFLFATTQINRLSQDILAVKIMKSELITNYGSTQNWYLDGFESIPYKTVKPSANYGTVVEM